MIVYRITRAKYAKDLSGEGARVAGGRWNTKGKAMLYTASSRALALLELLANLPAGIIPKDFVIVQLALPKGIKLFTPKRFPPDWSVFPHPNATKFIGDRFLVEEKYLAMRVPSVFVPDEYNVLINPTHPMAASIRIVSSETIEVDGRLIR